MSGERDPLASIGAAIEALKNDDALKVFLVGDESIIAEHFPEELMHRAEIIHTDEVVSMDESPVDALRKKKNSSMRLSVNLVSEGKADACVSSGNTGALMANAKYVLKTLPTIDRPAFMKAIPTKEG
jgi:Fatty acid/phospholipid biosynthesis enzyme